MIYNHFDMRLLSIFFLLVFTCCSPKKTDKPRVLTSTPPYQYFVERIAKGLVEVDSIVPPGVDSHTFEPTPRQRVSFEQSSLWFQIGEPFESSLKNISEKKLARVDLYTGISASSDRHFWLSPKLAAQQVSLITTALSEKFPEHALVFKANETQLLKELASLDRQLHHTLSKARGRILLVSHPSFGHFCRDYSLEQLSIEHEGKEPLPKHLESLLHRVDKSQNQLVLISLPQHNNKGLEVIAERFQLPMHEIDPYTHDYFSMMHTLAEWVTHDHN